MVMADKTDTKSFREKWIQYILSLQSDICRVLENTDEKAKFKTDEWQRHPDGKGGGGKTMIISNGNVFEKGGVNTSVVYGKVTDTMRNHLKIEGEKWFACGLSLVIHPLNPFVPTVHANWRYLEIYDQGDNVSDRWFGGGADLTPYYLFEEDAGHFHQTLKNAMDPFGKELYPRYKRWCDEYFNNSHRGAETRGIGGVFYDHLKPAHVTSSPISIRGEEQKMDLETLLNFQKANGDCFIDAYIPIVEKRKDLSWNAENKYWQEIRRGRYVEFNLLHDRGTLFGLKTNGRLESILMSLPPTVRFDYNYQPKEGSEEWKLLEVCKNPKDWV